MNPVSRLLSAMRHAIFRTAAVNLTMLAAVTVTGILVARALGEDGRGYFASIVAAQGVGYVVAELGQSAAVTYAVSRSPESATSVLRASRRITLPAAVITTLAGCLMSPLLADGERSVLLGYCLAFGSILVNGIGGPSLYSLQALSIQTWNRARIIQPVSYLVVSLGLFFTKTLTITSASAALMASYCLSMGMAWVRERQLRPIASDDPPPINLTAFGLKQAGSSIPEVLSSSFDRLILLSLVGAAPLGQYAVAQSVTTAAGPLGTAVSSVAFPALAADASRGASRRSREMRFFLIAGMMTGVTLLAACSISPWAVPLLFGSAFRPAVALVWILAPTVLLRSLLQVSSTMLRGRGTPGLATFANLSCLLATGVLLVILTSRWGLAGAAVATACGQALGLAVSTVLLRVASHEETT